MQMSAAMAMARRATLLGAEPLHIHQSPRRGQRVGPARADADQPVCRLQHVAGAGEHQRDLGIGDRHHRLQAAQVAIGAPVLGELDAGAGELAGMLLQLALQPLEEGEGIGRGAREARDNAPPSPRRRTLRAFALMTVCPSVTWPSPATTTAPSLRTERIVVPCHTAPAPPFFLGHVLLPRPHPLPDRAPHHVGIHGAWSRAGQETPRARPKSRAHARASLTKMRVPSK